MKTTLAFLCVATLVSMDLRADPIIVKKRALEVRDQNNVRQGIASPSQPARPAATPATPATPTPVAQSSARLRADLTAIKANAQVTAAQKQQITKDLIGLAHGANKPSEATAGALANSLAAAFAVKPLSERDCSRLMSDLAAVLNPGNIQATQMQAIHNDIQAIFQSNGMSRGDAVKLVDQVKAVGAQAR